jgi:hypothetical protein
VRVLEACSDIYRVQHFIYGALVQGLLSVHAMMASDGPCFIDLNAVREEHAFPLGAHALEEVLACFRRRTTNELRNGGNEATTWSEAQESAHLEKERVVDDGFGDLLEARYRGEEVEQRGRPVY